MRIILSYQTQQLPAPYAYAAVMTIDTKNQGMLDVEFSLEYLDRDELSDDELHAEGFTRNDNFEWKGEITNQWRDEVEGLKDLSYKQEPHSDVYLHVAIDEKSLNFPEQIDQADMLFQELLQAILEKAELEAPLSIEIILDKRPYKLIWVFSERLIKVNGEESKEWKSGRTLLKTIYGLDFASAPQSKKPGNSSINLGEGLWYQISDKTVKNKLAELVNSLMN